MGRASGRLTTTMSEGTLYDAVWDRHKVAELPNGQDQLFVGLHLVHEVTSPQPFSELEERGLNIPYPDRTIATADHIIPTEPERRQTRPLEDAAAESMLAALERKTRETGITYYGLDSENQGITHVVAPELGLTQPGMTIVCGDSHTATHGAFGAIAFGIGTSQVRDVLGSQCVAADKLAVRRVEVTGSLGPGVGAKDVILKLIAELGVDGGVGYAYEYGGPAIRELDMEGRLSVCNMAIEGGARIGYINPDETTYEYLRGREFVPEGEAFAELKAYWESVKSAPDAEYDDVVTVDADGLAPMVTWGTTPGQSIEITEPVPEPEDLDEPGAAREAQSHIGVEPGDSMLGYPIDVAFIGTCTNGRVSDFRQAARVLDGETIDGSVRGIAVPGSQTVKTQLEADGIDEVFIDAGFEWRAAGCSMCIAMNDDQLYGDERCASSSNRNYVGRQGSKDGRTVLMSPAMVAAAAVNGEITDARNYVGDGA